MKEPRFRKVLRPARAQRIRSGRAWTESQAHTALQLFLKPVLTGVWSPSSDLPFPDLYFEPPYEQHMRVAHTSENEHEVKLIITCSLPSVKPHKQSKRNRLKYLLSLYSLFGFMVQPIQSPKLEMIVFYSFSAFLHSVDFHVPQDILHRCSLLKQSPIPRA